MQAAIETPMTLQGLSLSLESSIGIALYPDDGDDVETLLQCADGAMYQAKEEKSGSAFYDSSRVRQDTARLTLMGELRRALDRRELVLFYQPKAVLADGEVHAVEALLRWEHPVRGLVAPDDFIPAAQQTGLIKPLTRYVIDEALRQCRSWQDEGLRLAIAVNLSARNLLDADLPELVAALLERWNVEPCLLELEITESAMLADPTRTKLILERLSAMGIRLSIDDFGTGYSSLAYLKRLPVSEVKVDRSFVLNMETDEDDATIVRSTIDLARNLGLDVVAEGVETKAVWDRLRTLGCTAAQGYYLSRRSHRRRCAPGSWNAGERKASPPSSTLGRAACGGRHLTPAPSESGSRSVHRGDRTIVTRRRWTFVRVVGRPCKKTPPGRPKTEVSRRGHCAVRLRLGRSSIATPKGPRCPTRPTPSITVTRRKTRLRSAPDR